MYPTAKQDIVIQMSQRHLKFSMIKKQFLNSPQSLVLPVFSVLMVAASNQLIKEEIRNNFPSLFAITFKLSQDLSTLSLKSIWTVSSSLHLHYLHTIPCCHPPSPAYYQMIQTSLPLCCSFYFIFTLKLLVRDQFLK